jgi:hypothetical protein
MPSIKHTCIALGMAYAVVLGGGNMALAQSAGQVEFARGVGFAQFSGQTPRTLGQGLTLKEGDRLTTSEGAYAIVKLQDGTQMTLRPNSELLIQQYQFKENATDNSMLMRLFKGGFRAVTGLINKSTPNAARVQTTTSTIGIRGTDFDARLCSKDCKGESAKVPEAARPNAVLASAKVVLLLGEASVVDTAGVRRRAVQGGSVYPGDVVETAAGATAVFAFRDDSRVTIGSATRFKVDSFVFDQDNPTEGRFVLSLLRGSMRALTGLIGKANNRNVSFATPTSTIGIRGTGLDMDCTSEASCSVFTWLGTIEVTPRGQTALQVLQAGQGLFVGPDGIRVLNAPTLDNLPRPDEVKVDTKQLFSSAALPEGEEGLYVFVRDGHIEITTATETLHLGKGEAGFADDKGQVVRPLRMPLFLDFDVIPRPDSKNQQLRSVLNDAGVRTINQCK